MSVNLPTTFSDGAVPTASQLNGNFSAVANRSIRNTDIASDAAIDRTKLAQRYVPQTIWLPAIDYTANGNLGAAGGSNDPGDFTGLDTSWVEIGRFYLRVPSGAQAWLSAVDLQAKEVAANPEVRLQVDSVVIGDAALVLATSGAKYSVARPNPFQNPLIPIANNSIFTVEVQDTGSGSSLIRGLNLSVHLKQELTA